MQIEEQVALVTVAASGIGEATARELARRGVKAVALVDRSPHVGQVARAINDLVGRPVAEALVGDASDEDFRSRVFAVQFALLNLGIGVGGAVSGLLVDVHRVGSFQVIYLVDALSSLKSFVSNDQRTAPTPPCTYGENVDMPAVNGSFTRSAPS